MQQAIPNDLVDTRTAARIAGVHVSSVYRWVLSGRLRGWKRAGARYLISRADLAGMLREVRPRA